MTEDEEEWKKRSKSDEDDQMRRSREGRRGAAEGVGVFVGLILSY